VPHASVTWARGSFDSPRGAIAVAWHTEDDTLHITVNVPPTCTATIVFPDGEELTAGPGRFTARRPVDTE
jgi:alpha-L-rhamnosidase